MTNPTLLVGEMKEFSGFSSNTQRYIRRSLDVALEPNVSSREIADHYDVDVRCVQEQKDYYKFLKEAKDKIPYECELPSLRGFFDSLVIASTYDLAQHDLPSFSSYRFLYERILTAEVRPWLVSSFCAAAAMPNIAPDSRRDLLQSLAEKVATAPRWSPAPPGFFPRWFEPDTP